jgi:hypothetical protein
MQAAVRSLCLPAHLFLSQILKKITAFEGKFPVGTKITVDISILQETSQFIVEVT